MAIMEISKISVPGSNPGVPAMRIFKILKEKIILFVFRIFSRLETYFGLPVGYLTGHLGAGEEVGKIGRVPSIIFNLGNWQLHLHHWLISLAILIFVFSFLAKKYKIPNILLFFGSGFLIGLIFNGIFCYGDWYKILIR